MLFKRLNISFYKKIKLLIIKNGFQIPNYFFWKKLWDNNPKTIIGDGLFFKNNLVGYHSYFRKKLVFRGKNYNILVSSNWNVEKKFRNYSIFLINRYFNIKNDIFLTTTANDKVSEIWKTLGAKEVNNSGCKKIIFKILNSKNFINIYGKKKKLSFLIFLSPFLQIFLDIYIKLKSNPRSNKDYNFKHSTNLDLEINKFNLMYENDSEYPMEKRSKKELQKYLNIINHNKNFYIIKIYKKLILVGYAILIREKIKNSKYKRMYMAEIRMNNNCQNNINEVFNHMAIFSKKKKCDVIEYRNLNSRILKKIKNKYYFARYVKNNPYLIKFGPNISHELKKYTKINWETSYLDGDCLL